MPDSPPPTASAMRKGPTGAERETADREYARWLGRVETRAVLPLKWGMLGISVLYWVWARDWAPPSNAVFALFFVYGASNLAFHYLFWRDRVAGNQTRVAAYVSYFIDLLFITLAIWFDLSDPAAGVASVSPGSDYTLLYLLLILRGFALLRSAVEQTIVTVLVSILFLTSLLWESGDGASFASKGVMLRLALIWGVMLLATFLVNLVNQQKEEMLRARERLVRNEGLASLGELAAGVAHEINNPIGIIKTYADFLERVSDADDPRREDYETIRKEAERCESIVRRMLDFANPNVREMKRVSVDQVVEDVIAFAFHGKEEYEGVRVDFDVEATPPPVLADEGQLRQAFLNIIMNARQILAASEIAGALISVRVKRRPGPRAPVSVTVRDNGPGIAPEDAEKAFEPFFTRRDGGTGLGLAITRRIIEAHGGDIEIWPAANGGTTVAISLPIADEDL